MRRTVTSPEKCHSTSDSHHLVFVEPETLTVAETSRYFIILIFRETKYILIKLKKVLFISIEKRNLTIMWFANFLVAASATMVLPFLSLYLETFGNYDSAFIQRWSGYVFGITFLIAFFISPDYRIWNFSVDFHDGIRGLCTGFILS
jgi:hypothetical protein